MFSLPHEEEQVTLLMKEGKYSDATILLEQIIPQFEAAEAWEKYAKHQNLYSESLWRYSQLEKGVTEAEKALAVCRSHFGELHPETARSLNNLGACQLLLGNYKKAIDYYQHSLEIRLVVLEKDHYDIGVNYNNLGLCQNNFGRFTKAIEFQELALFIFKRALGEFHPYIGGCFNNLGTMYEQQGNHAKAIAYQKKALIIKKKVISEEHPETAMTYNNLGVSYKSQGDYNRAIFYTQKALSIRLTTLGDQHIDTGLTYNNLGIYCIKKGDYGSAFSYLQQALTIFTAQQNKFHLKAAALFNNLADCYLQQGNQAQALVCYQQAINISIAIFGEINYETAFSYCCMANYYQMHQLPTQALQYLKKALHSLDLSQPNVSEYWLPDIKGYNGILELLDILTIKASAFYSRYHHTLLAKDLFASMAYFQCADQLIDQFRQSYRVEGSRLILAEKGKELVCDKGLEAIWQAEQLFRKVGHEDYKSEITDCNNSLNYSLLDTPLDMAFYFAEKSKAILLNAGIKEAEAIINTQLPSELIEKEQSLRIDLTFQNQIILEEESKPVEEQDRDTLSEWQNLHFDNKLQYDNLIEYLEKEYPDYYRLKYDLKTANISEIQTAFTPETALVSYVLTDKYLYSFVINATGSQWLQQLLPASFDYSL